MTNSSNQKNVKRNWINENTVEQSISEVKVAAAIEAEKKASNNLMFCFILHNKMHLKLWQEMRIIYVAIIINRIILRNISFIYLQKKELHWMKSFFQ